MAYFLLIADHPKWPLYMVASYLDQTSSYVSFDLRRTRQRRRQSGCKDMFMLTWSLSENRLIDTGSEWRDLCAYDAQLAQWARGHIEKFMTEGKIDVEIENRGERQSAAVVAG